tara:strand:+ start:238 stop:510 length:273 start_codon:yes stop_codon:yes gene_type:complete
MNDKDNKLIALFMGLKQDPHNEYYLIDENKDVGYEHIHESCFLYDSSWDWLMPVIIKIADMLEATHYPLYRSIDEAYNEAVTFIKTFNEK